MFSMRLHLALHEVEGVDHKRFPVAEQGGQDRQTHGGFRGGHSHGKQHEVLPDQVLVQSAEADEVEVHGVHHQLYREEDYEQVPSHEHPGRPDDEEERGKHEVPFDWYVHRYTSCSTKAEVGCPSPSPHARNWFSVPPSLWANKIAPTIPTRRISEAISKGRSISPNNVSPRTCTLPPRSAITSGDRPPPTETYVAPVTTKMNSASISGASTSTAHFCLGCSCSSCWNTLKFKNITTKANRTRIAPAYTSTWMTAKK